MQQCANYMALGIWQAFQWQPSAAPERRFRGKVLFCRIVGADAEEVGLAAEPPHARLELRNALVASKGIVGQECRQFGVDGVVDPAHPFRFAVEKSI